MHAEVFNGQLTYVDTAEGQIQLKDRNDHEVTTIDITTVPNVNWEELMGFDVEAVVVDGKTKQVYMIKEDE